MYPALILTNFVGNASTPLIRRSCFIEVGPFDSGLRKHGAQGAEDLKLYLALAERYDFALVPQFLVGYRQTRDSMSKDVEAMIRSTNLVLADAQRCHPELPSRLFRWARAGTHLWLGSSQLESDGMRAAAPLLLRAALVDPPAVFNLPFLRWTGRTILRHRLLPKFAVVGRVANAIDPAATPRAGRKGVLGLPFIESAAEPEVPLPRVSRLDRKRFAYLLSLRIRRAQETSR